MTYANPVHRHGLLTALKALRDAGTTGLIVPDLSLEESRPWRAASQRAGISLVLLAAPAASPERVARIARASNGFLYLVSRYGTTGRAGPATSLDLRPLVRASHRAVPELPVLVGFGVRDPASARRALSSGADGVVIGSALEERRAAGVNPSALGRWLSAIVRSIPALAPG
jgi:tryptophan synthase alpha chain